MGRDLHRVKVKGQKDYVGFAIDYGKDLVIRECFQIESGRPTNQELERRWNEYDQQSEWDERTHTADSKLQAMVVIPKPQVVSKRVIGGIRLYGFWSGERAPVYDGR
jgi:hypothetical protein